MSDETQPIKPTKPAAVGLSRRTIVRTGAHAAWAAPVIVAVSAVPAFASSVGETLTFNRGTSFYDDLGPYYVDFQGISLTSGGLDIAAGQLTASITSSGAPANHFYNDDPGPLWTLVGSTAAGLATYTWTYGPALAAGQSPTFAGSSAWSAASGATAPNFTVIFEAPGYEQSVNPFTPPV